MRVTMDTGINWVRQASWFLFGQGLSQIGSQVVQFALIWHLTIDSRSGATVTVATLVGMLPMVLLAPFGGMLADRYSRRKLIAVADTLVAITTVLLLLLLMAGQGSYLVFFAALLLRGCGQGVQVPAVAALLPQIVPAKQLGRFNGYNASIHAAMTLLSPILAAALLGIMPLHLVLLVDIVTALIGVGILLLALATPPPEGASDARRRHPLGDIVEGVRYIHGNHFVRRLLAYFVLLNFLAAPVALLTPLQVVRTFGGDETHLTVVEVAFSAGMILGGILVGFWGTRSSRTTTVSSAILVLGGLTIALGLPTTFLLYSAIMLVSGVFLPFLNTPAITMVQLSVEEKLMGRVSSILMMISNLAVPLGMAVMGPLADRFSVELLLLVTGASMLLVGLRMVCDGWLRANEPNDAAQASM
ncbi:MFS transporter [Tessaracoccus sp. OH4464_COT-324]|nr:MFS transporter [Tessaracoccus sp. OH4464_COT-324]